MRERESCDYRKNCLRSPRTERNLPAREKSVIRHGGGGRKGSRAGKEAPEEVLQPSPTRDGVTDEDNASGCAVFRERRDDTKRNSRHGKTSPEKFASPAKED